MQCRLILRMKLPYMAKVGVVLGDGWAVWVLLAVEWLLLSSVRNVVEWGERVYMRVCVN